MDSFVSKAGSFSMTQSQRQAEAARLEFVDKFNWNKLENLTLEEYAIGQPNQDNFCYWVERKLIDLGSILGSTSAKFGVYFASDTQFIQWTRWTNNDFDTIRDALLDLISAGESQAIDRIKKSPLSPMFKAKILSLYYPERFMNIFSDNHIKYFLDKLGISYKDNSNSIDLRELLIDYKSSNDVFSSWTAIEFGYYLYEHFGKPAKVVDKQLNTEDWYDNMQSAAVNRIIQNKDPTKRTKRFSDVPRPRTELIETQVGTTYERNDKIKVQAIEDSGYSCEIDPSHESFLRKNRIHLYTEAHHLIPMARQELYDLTLDTPANIVSLCSRCHDWLHYGAEPEELLRKLFEKRIERLISVGLDTTFEELLGFYT